MHGTSDAAAVDEFLRAAKAILTRRVHNARPKGMNHDGLLVGFGAEQLQWRLIYAGKSSYTGLCVFADCFYLFD